jgi:hypothetical protein
MLSLLFAGCVANLNWKHYNSVSNSTVASSKFVKDEFVIQLIGTDRSRMNSGLISDVGEPYSIHTRIYTYTEVVGYEIHFVEIEVESRRETLFADRLDPVEVIFSQNKSGMYVGSYTFKEVVNYGEPPIKLRIEGKIRFDGHEESFSLEKTFKIKEGKARWLSPKDLIQV